MGFHFQDNRFTETERTRSKGYEELVLQRFRERLSRRYQTRRCRQDYLQPLRSGGGSPSNMVRIGTIVAKNATQEALKAVPGASIAYKIVTKSVQDFNNSDKLEVDAKAANMLTLEKEATENSKLHEQAQTNMPGADLKASNIANSHPVVKLKAKM